MRWKGPWPICAGRLPSGVSGDRYAVNVLAVLGAMLIGGIAGSLLKIEARLESFGGWLRTRLGRGFGFGSDPVNRDYLQRSVGQTGAVITGRVTYDASLPWWGADNPTGPARLPVFVVTHSEPATSPEGGVYTFVTDGIESALKQAGAAAGDLNVTIMGGAEIGRQCIAAGLVDE
jgi:dihydrofolate reductase